jgi:cell wall-associated NlpC family hydrolase
MNSSVRALAVGTATVVGAATMAFASPAQAAPAATVPSAVASHSQLGSVTGTAFSTYQSRVGATVTARVMRLTSVSAANSKIGAYYRYGSAGPTTFDCSGLTSFAWKKAGKTIPRTSRQQYSALRKVSASHRQPGDLVFFFRNGVSHVGLYAGNNTMIHAPGSGKRVRKDSLSGTWYQRHLTGYARVV